ncbi:MAG: GHMP kinase [Nitrospinota bacterium]|nr:GHMP kinase [Nitrospinota bacterium]
MSPRSVEAAAPARIDLAGGTLDIWPLNLMFPSATTVNMAVSVMARATVSRSSGGKVLLVSRDQRAQVSFPSIGAIHHNHKLGLVSRLAAFFLEGKEGATITTSCDAPAGSGLGGSSALNIALCRALAMYAGKRMTKSAILDIAKDIEAAHLGIPTGLQDYLAALYGGANVFRFPPGGVAREKIPASTAADLERMVSLFYSGAARSSGINNWQMFRLVMEKDKRVMRLFGRIADCAAQAGEALLEEDMEGFEAAVKDEWHARRQLFPGISTPAIDGAITAGKKAGATTARICGAGGGGCFFMISAPENRDQVVQAVEKTGARPMRFKLARAATAKAK